jgi:hypothetical protein
MIYLALDKKTRRAFEPDLCTRWDIVPMPPPDVLRGGYSGYSGLMEHLLYRDRDPETGRVHWIDYQWHTQPEREEYGQEAEFDIIIEITEEEAHALLAGIGVKPPDTDLPPIICSESELVRRYGLKPHYSNFSDAGIKQGRIARYERISYRSFKYWLTNTPENIRILKEIEREKNAGAQPSPHGDPT